MLDASACSALCEAVSEGGRMRDSIGLLKEKTLHAVCKNIFAPDPACQEVSLGHFVADCFDGMTVTEIQTRSFYPLQKKLRFFLQQYSVNVVKPLIRYRTIYWVHPQSGEVSAGRKSSKTGRPSDILEDLFWLDDLFPHPNLTVTVLPCDAADYRLLDGFGTDRKSHATKQDLVPVSFQEPIVLRSVQDAFALLPPLPDPFTLKELQHAAHMTPRVASHGVKWLRRCGYLQKAGQRGRAFLYSAAEKPPCLISGVDKAL